MATIDDLPHKSIADMTVSEGIERIRQIRLSRRTTKVSTKKRTANRTKRKQKKIPTSALTAAQAKQLLSLLEEEE